VRVLVFGGRDFRNKEAIWQALDDLHATNPVTLLIEGGQVSVDPSESHLPWKERTKWGADHFGHMWALSRKVPHKQYRADWRTHGKSAGPRRNEQMAALDPDLGMQCPGGRGTADMRMRLDHRQIEVMEIW
jgi:hypothetical protein